ncbi:MAG: RdgB/HAM1 family non-canonical purine NTP pyrophosphatase [Chthoniobacterales bacterium]
MHLLLATRNLHKQREFSEMLGEEFALETLSRHPEIAEVVETGTTFAANAELKAVTVSRQLFGLVLADDSGLEVDSLGGAPGVYSARYAGEGATDVSNRKKLLSQLTLLGPGVSRVARFRCVLVLSRSGSVITTFEGVAEGTILEKERGTAGFGYDSVFQPDGFSESFAELSAVQKNTISHRASAVRRLHDFLRRSRSSRDA